MRINALSRAYEQEFMKYGIPCRVYGGFKFFERKEIKDILSYLKIVNNPHDDESFLRCVSTPKRGIGDKTLRELREYCYANSISMCEGLSQLEHTSIGGAAKSKLYNFGLMLDGFKTFSQNNKVVNLIDHILETTGFLEQFAEKSEENTSKLYNISELKNSAEQFAKDNYGSTLADYLNSVTLSTDIDDINSEDAVTIATIHASKGLEYTCVFVAGLDQDILPIARSKNDEAELEEERRLMYVAVTRARERLYLTRAMSRYLYGRREHMVQSQFLKEAQVVLSPVKVEEKKAYSYAYEKNFASNDDDLGYSNSTGGYSSSYAKSMLNSSKPKVNANYKQNQYKSGTRVKHAKFGEGVVVCVKGEGENVIVDVAFKGIGIKSLSAKFAPMEII